ncbi:MAG: serine/threonine-protein kinase [Planctomycetota bacterium]
MSQSLPDPPPNPKPPTPEPSNLEQRSAAETFLLPNSGTPEKQSEDVALAGELLKSGYLSDRQLTAALADWSVHGDVSLAEHLRRSSALTDEQIAQLQAGAVAKASAVMEAASVAGDASESVSLVETLEQLDETGRVAKLLGVSVASGVANQDSRTTGNRYRLIRKLGQGGLGRVWLARDQNLQRLVALKEVTNAGDATDRTIARFRHEAEITGRLEHPGIVPVHQLGDDAETGFAFYTMRFLGKGTLQDSIDEHHERRNEGDDDPMRLRHLLTAFVNICHAIGHAHSRNVIHRDLKPENVVIDSFGQVIVIDWGLAKILDDAAVEEVGSGSISGGDGSGTVEGQVLGTPLYMAPEQAGGRLDEVDTRTDIYGLGTILFSIITGYAPHEKTQADAVKSGGGPRALISAIVSGPTPNALEFERTVDPALAAICACAMARRRYARYQTASDLAEEVQRWMADEPVAAYEEPPLKKARRWIARRPRTSQAIALAASLALASVMTLGVWTQQSRMAAQQTRFEQMRGDAREVELQLRSSANDLSSDVRFMAGLPPIQGIIRAQAGAEGDDEATWRTRLETIYTGLLRSEPDYLAIAYVASVDGAAQELVRVERSVGDRMLIRSLPASRLRLFEEDPFLTAVLQLEPGETQLSPDPRPWQSEAAMRVKRGTTATPIYADDTGQPFGMVAIEADVRRQLEQVLNDLGQVTSNVYITDQAGVVLACAEAGKGVTGRWAGTPIAKLVPAAAAAFPDSTEETAIDDGFGVVAMRVMIDPLGIGAGIVVALPPDD